MFRFQSAICSSHRCLEPRSLRRAGKEDWRLRENVRKLFAENVLLRDDSGCPENASISEGLPFHCRHRPPIAEVTKHPGGGLSWWVISFSSSILISNTAKEDKPEPLTLCTVDVDTNCACWDWKKAKVRQNPTNFLDYCIPEGRMYLVKYHDFQDSNNLRQTTWGSTRWLPISPMDTIAPKYFEISLRVYTFISNAKDTKFLSTSGTPTVSTDFMGPLLRSKKGNTFVVVFQDRFTKWTQCCANRRATAKAIYCLGILNPPLPTLTVVLLYMFIIVGS